MVVGMQPWIKTTTTFPWRHELALSECGPAIAADAAYSFKIADVSTASELHTRALRARACALAGDGGLPRTDGPAEPGAGAFGWEGAGQCGRLHGRTRADGLPTRRRAQLGEGCGPNGPG